MLELLLLSLCLGSNMDDNACQKAWEKTKEQNPGIDDRTKFYQRAYVDKLPVEILWVGSAASMVYKKEVKFGLYKGIYVDLRDQGTGLIGYKISFP